MADMPGVTIQPNKLEEHLGLPVVLLSGKTGMGLQELTRRIEELTSERTAPSPAYYKLTSEEQSLADRIRPVMPDATDYALLQLAHHADWLEHLDDAQRDRVLGEKASAAFQGIQAQISETLSRFSRFTPVIRQALRLEKGGAGIHLTDRIDRWIMHPVLGAVIFFLIMLLVFQAIFSWATVPMDAIEAGMSRLTDGFRGIMPDGWLEDLVADGLLAGLTGILVFIPQIAILFLIIGILEEVGYMARAVSMFDVSMRKIGLNGRSIVALVSGGACAIPAIMSTRNISNWKERLITIMVTPFISCSARIPVYAILIGFAVPKGRVWGFDQQGLALMGLYGFGILAAILAALVLKHFIRTTDRSFLMMELPVYRPPVAKNLALLVYEKTRAFVVGAGKIILVISLVLWFLASFGPGGNAGEHGRDYGWISEKPPLESSFAGILGKGIEPVIEPLGFDWKIGIALICSFAAREVFVGTMATIYSIEDDTDESSIRTSMANDVHASTGLPVYTSAATWALLLFYVFAMQCMSTLAIVRRETKSWKWPIIQFFMMTVLAYLASLAAYQLLA
jgi:ferrous iron transport protein B